MAKQSDELKLALSEYRNRHGLSNRRSELRGVQRPYIIVGSMPFPSNGEFYVEQEHADKSVPVPPGKGTDAELVIWFTEH